jgi:hypothetical protein
MQKTFVVGEEMTERNRPGTRFSEDREYHSRSIGIFFKGLKKCLEPKAVAAGQAGSLHYYNFEIHRAAFARPHFFSRVISKSTLGGDCQ